MRFIKLTTASDGLPILINLDQIIAIYPCTNPSLTARSVIVCNNDVTYYVEEIMEAFLT